MRFPVGLSCSLVAAVGAFSLASEATADTVYLKNGRSFEGVVAEAGDQQVEIHLQEGSITIPRTLVDHVDKSATALTEYLSRQRELRRSNAGSKAWLDLAAWAEERGMPQPAREAALKAAAMNPRLPGLSVVLGAQGYVFDEGLGRWMTRDEQMRRRGMVQVDGEWITRREATERAQAEQDQWLQQQSLLLQAQTAQASRDAALMMAQLQASGGGYAADPYGLYGYGLGYSPLVLGTAVGGFGFGRFPRSGFSGRGFRTHIPAAVPHPRASGSRGHPFVRR